MKLVASLLACAALLAGAADASAAKKDKDKPRDTPSAASKPALIGSFGDWKVYHTASGRAKICYLLSQPKKRDPDDANREQAYAFISERPSEHVRNEIAFKMGTDLVAAADEKKKTKKPKRGDDAGAPTVVVGDAEFDLAPKGSDLWVKNPAEEGKVIEEMRKGANLVIRAAARKGGRVIDTYSLSGFSQAVDKALKDCPES